MLLEFSLSWHLIFWRINQFIKRKEWLIPILIFNMMLGGFLGGSLEDPWGSPGGSLADLPKFLGWSWDPLEDPWRIIGASLEVLWGIHGRTLEDSWRIIRGSFGDLWRSLGGSLEDPGRSPEVSLGDLWRICRTFWETKGKITKWMLLSLRVRTGNETFQNKALLLAQKMLTRDLVEGHFSWKSV